MRSLLLLFFSKEFSKNKSPGVSGACWYCVSICRGKAPVEGGGLPRWRSEVDRIAPGSAALGVGDAPAGVASGGEVGGQVVFG